MIETPLNAPAGLDGKVKSINNGDAHAPSADEAHADFCFGVIADLSQHIATGDNNKPFHRKGDASGQKVFVDNVSRVFGARGDYRQVSLDICERLVEMRDLEGKAYVARQRKIGKSASGEPIFPQQFMSLWKFCENFEPDGRWITASEWQAILDKYSAILAADKLAELGDDEYRKADEAKRARARAAADNPNEFLAAGIARGVSEVLKNLGVVPQPTTPLK